MKFVHIADVHLGMSFKSASFSKTFGNKKRDAIKKNIQEVISYIQDNSIELLLIAGDFLEGDYIELSDILDVKYLFESIPDTSIVMMAGNHDPLSPQDNVYKLVQWPDHVYLVGTDYETFHIEKLNTSIVSVSWDSKGPLSLNKEKLEEEIANIKAENKILMLHGDAYSQNDYFYVDPNYLSNLKVDYVALGHIHKQDIIKEKVVYPGSLEALDFSENYSHGFIVAELVLGELSIESQESMILPMTLVTVDITGCESYLEILDKSKLELYKDSMVDKLLNVMVRIRLIGEKNPYIGDFEQRYYDDLNDLIGNQIAYIEVKDKTVMGYDIDVLYSEHEDDLIGHFIRSMKEKGLEDEVNQKALSTGITLLLEAMR